ncbi:uncharacterized protein LOC102717375 isoform X2 [Oryza brachyantha]|uniref:uncharacterized protein LOC102717375 isoform X2 n=1 Tax=Oryza brachyantha TaxID=4533 RepID=UPI0003EA947B|nr:uncharacterized protein LOC102717375 isoform X2 [Oryza brachyantha]
MLPYPRDRLVAAAPYPAATASSSSLSPSAAPFTVDDCPRPAPADPRVPNPSSLDLPTAPSLHAAAGDWGSASWMEPPASYMAPAPPSSYKGEVPESSPYGIFSGTHCGNFLDIRPLRSESSQSTSAKGPGTWLGSSEVLPSGVGPSVFSRQQNNFLHKSEDADPYPTQQGLLQYPAYDKYMPHLSSCSTDAPAAPPMMWTPPVNSSEVAAQMFSVMNKNTGESSSSFSPYMNPCRINLDYFDCMWNEQKDHGHHIADKHHKKWGSSATASNMAAGGNHLLNSIGEDHHVGRCLGNGRPMQESSEIKYDWGNINSKVSPSEVGYVQPREFSSELPEVNNPTVDSPCWKGAPVAYSPSFGIIKNTDNPHCVKGVGCYNSSHQIEQSPEWSLKYSELFSKQQELLASENVKSDTLKTFKLPMTRKNSEDHKAVPPICDGVHNGIDNHSYFLEEQNARRHRYYGSAEGFNNVMAASQQENTSVSKAKLLGEDSANHIASITEESINKGPSPLGSAPRVPIENLSESLHVNVSSQAARAQECTRPQILANGGQDQYCYHPDARENMLKTSCDSNPKSRVVLLKQMHDLSAMLLSNCNGGPSLQEHEEELLQLVIQNLRDASFSRSKVQNTSCSKNNLWMAMPEDSLLENTSELKTSISQAVAKLPEDKMLDDTDISQLSIYKNLWVEAEASACKLKYELQLIRVKLATMKNHNTQGTVDSSKDNNTFISTISTSKLQNYDKEITAYPVNLQCLGGDSCDGQPSSVNRSIVDGADAEVIDQWNFLQSNFDNYRSFCANNNKEQEEASQKPCPIEDAVMARLRVLNSRPNNIASSKQENNNNQLDTSTNREANIDDAVMSRLRILKSRPDNVTPLGQESSKLEPDAASTDRTDLIDNAVMSRLRILKCRNDNINSLVDVSKKCVEDCTDQPNRDEYDVIAKMQAPSGNSIAEECQNIPYSDNFVKHSEGKDFVGGLDSLVDATCGDEDSGCKDQVNDKSAVQSEGSQETPPLPSSVHKYDMFPPEWEHVLKENFFHPGK